VDGLLGRDQQCGRLDQLLDDSREGLSGVLVLRGEPGVGKTALLDYAQAAASLADVPVIRIDGVETEMELSFAALHQFLRSCLGSLDTLPPLETAGRQQGAMVLLSLALSYAGARGLLAGDLAETERCFAEMTALAEARGQPWTLGTLLCAAWRGVASQAYPLLDVVSAEASRQGQGYQLVFADYARCILELGQGRYDAAYASLAAGIDGTSQIKFALPDLVEAAQRSGHLDVARDAVGLLTRLAAGHPGPVTLGFLSRGQALILGDSVTAEDHYLDAIRQHGQAPGPAHLARSHLVYGEWLRRGKRPRDARESLRTAHRLFEDIGAQGFARRARLELSAAGETVPAQAIRRGHELTPQEAQVARLAAGGATNAEIAGQLYLSPNTVDYHLRKVFRKLGITSRRQLARALLPDRRWTGSPASLAGSWSGDRVQSVAETESNPLTRRRAQPTRTPAKQVRGPRRRRCAVLLRPAAAKRWAAGQPARLPRRSAMARCRFRA
jgi:DNA-binding CsgD family transcriptional regulator